MLEIEKIIEYTLPLKLLYVEDNMAARVSTIIILEEFFENIIVANDGQEGLELFKENEIDLIVTDINMPRLNGLEMIEAVRKIDEDVSILVLSAYNESGFFMESIKLGVEGYLLKPIDMHQFLLMLDKFIQKVKLEEESENNLHLLQQYQELTDKSSIVSITDLSGKITYVNDKLCDISEYSRDELIGKNHNIVRHPQEDSEIYKDMWNTIKIKKEIWVGVIRNLSKYGHNYYVKTTVKPILDSENNIVEYISIKDDITSIMSPKRQLQDLSDSFNESLTFLMKIEAFNDLEKFYGLKLSQKIENEFSKKILGLMPSDCEFTKVFILGNGEYGFIESLQNTRIDLQSIVENLKELQLKISETMLDVGDIEYDINIIISFSYGENALENARYGLSRLIKDKQDFIIANNLIEKEQEEAQKNLETIKMVKKAIDEHKIVSYFQPIINNKTRQIEKYESLVRLIDVNGKVISPFFFIDIAKEGQYYSQITSMVLDNSFKALKNTDMDISINISVLDIEKKLTREKILKLLDENTNDLHRVIFELLEDQDVKDFKLIKSFIEKVKKMGVKIAIDDFGSGYSNFERLLDYQPDILKIDGSLIKNIENDSFSLNVVETIVSFAKKQNIKIVAEYVENENIFNILNDLDIDYSQGYYFGKAEAVMSKDII